MPSQEPHSDVELLDEALNDRESLALPSRSASRSASPQLRPPLIPPAEDDSDDDLPSLSQAFGPPKATMQTAASPYASSHSAQKLSTTAQRHSGGIKLVAVVSSPVSSSSQKQPASGPDAQGPPTSVQPHVSDRDSVDETLPHGRALRKRTQAQLQPYTVDWMKFAKTAQKNQWEGLVTREAMYGAQHRPETPEEVAARMKKHKSQKIHTHGGWLQPDAGQRAMHPEEEDYQEMQKDGRRYSFDAEESEAGKSRRTSIVDSSLKHREKGTDQSRSLVFVVLSLRQGEKHAKLQ